MVVDAGRHLALAPVGEQDTADDVHLPQLHRPAPSPALEPAVAAASGLRVDVSDDDLARQALDAKIEWEELGASLKGLPPGSAKAERTKQEAEQAMLGYAAVHAEGIRRKAARDVERGFEQVVSQRVMSRLRDEDAKALNEIMRRTNVDPDTKEWAQRTFDERYGTRVNGGPMLRHPNEERYGAARAEVEAQVRAEMEATKRDFVAYGNGRVNSAKGG